MLVEVVPDEELDAESHEPVEEGSCSAETSTCEDASDDDVDV